MADGKKFNSIGRQATGFGEVTIRFGNGAFTTSQQWYKVEGLAPDTIYQYQVIRAGKPIGSGTVRTWPAKSQSLTYFVIGDWGNASSAQYALAGRMEQERKLLEATDSPVRFVLSTGDTIYAGGGADRDWDNKFFMPYASTLSSIPFYSVLGNHDGNESESSWDLPAFLDNFFSPAGPMSRYYHFRFADLAEFFALDSTTNQHPGRTYPAYLQDGDQSRWLAEELKQQPSPWRIAVLHHPFFTAGPNHPPMLPKLGHWFQMFRNQGISAIFSGHEHNLQISQRDANTGDMQFIVSGAGGELRRSSILSNMKASHIAAWAPRVHFLLVQIEGDTMSITPKGIVPFNVLDAAGRPVPTPILVPRRQR